MLRAGRAPLPAKMTSSMSEPRSEVGRVSPMTQRSASNRFDLPQPFGPTIAVSPCSIWNSVGSTKDLNPESRSRVNFKGRAPPQRRKWVLRLFRFRDGGVQGLLERVPIALERHGLAADDKGRHAVDAIFARRLASDLGDLLG